MSQELLNRLHENGHLASQTAQMVTRLIESLTLTDEHRARMRPAIDSKQLEIALLIDQLVILDDSDEKDEMLRAAATIERLWGDISSRLALLPDTAGA